VTNITKDTFAKFNNDSFIIGDKNQNSFHDRSNTIINNKMVLNSVSRNDVIPNTNNSLDYFMSNRKVLTISNEVDLTNNKYIKQINTINE